MARSSDRPRRSLFVRFFVFIWRTLDFLRRLLLILIFAAILAGLWFVFMGQPDVRVPRGAALVWAPQGNLVDQPELGPSLAEKLLREAPAQSRVANLVTALDRAAGDPRISMAVLKLDEMGTAGMAQLRELAAAITRFRETGKPVIAYAPSYDQKAYYLAAHADRVYMDPIGQVFVQGFGLYQHYFKDALDKLGITVNVFRVGEYKAAVEPFIRNNMSKAAEQANRAWLQDLWVAYKDAVRPARGLEPGAIEDYVTHYADRLEAADGDAAQVALNAGLVDELVAVDELRRQVATRVGTRPEGGTFRQISDRQYLSATGGPLRLTEDQDIALVVVEGPIVMGESWANAAGGETIAHMIEKARLDDRIAALVLRVNSPGGSVYASERIRREVVRARQDGKPVVVSMSNLAASGGYWISMNANQIWAHPSTLTGSIGIFGLIPTFQEPLDDLGIHTDGLGTTPLADAFRIDMPLSDTARRIVQASIEQGYELFIGKIAEARSMSVSAVNEVAQGRVWSGAAAARLGLVDHLGGLKDATRAAAQLAGLAPNRYDLVPVLPDVDPATRLLDRLYGALAWTGVNAVLPDWLTGIARDDMHAVLGRSWLGDPGHRYSICLCRPDLGGGSR